MKRIGSDLNLGRLLLLVAICFSLSFDSAQANPNFEQNYGKVKRLYVEAGGVYFSLTGGVTAMKPVNGYYFIPKTHQSYADLVQLLYVSAFNRWPIQVRTEAALNANGHAHVVYLVVDL